jgi:hypothetical protein
MSRLAKASLFYALIIGIAIMATGCGTTKKLAKATALTAQALTTPMHVQMGGATPTPTSNENIEDLMMKVQYYAGFGQAIVILSPQKADDRSIEENRTPFPHETYTFVTGKKIEDTERLYTDTNKRGEEIEMVTLQYSDVRDYTTPVVNMLKTENPKLKSWAENQLKTHPQSTQAMGISRLTWQVDNLIAALSAE